MFLYQKLGYDYKHIDTSDLNSALRELADFIKKAIQEKPNYICYDTETDGLHIMKAKPFLVSIGFNKTVRTFDYNSDLVNALWKIYMLPDKDTMKTLQDNPNYMGLFAHNAKYDYHMMWNGGSKIPDDIRIYDSITIARLTEYADERESMSLENLGSKYVDDTSKFAGKIIKDVVKKVNADRRTKLRQDLMDAFPDDGLCTTTKKGTKKATKKLSDLIKEYDDTRTHFVNDDNKYFKFIDEHYKPANYKDAYEQEPELVRSYAADDIVIMIEYMNKAIPTLVNVDKDFRVLKREGELIRAVANMEKVGLKVDINYVLNARRNMIKYRDLLYFELGLYTETDFSVGQHAFIKKLLNDKYHIKTDKADEKALKYIRDNTDNDEVKCICTNILELRTIDKWLSTYVDGKLNSIVNGRIYTDINNSGAVSGRVSCDMQQQPKEALFDRNGNELFHPRRMFICDDDYLFAFCDESQMELRVQAYYTILHGKEPDLAMCRAYMPYKCYTNIISFQGFDDKGEEIYGPTRVEFDYNNIDHLKRFNDYEWHLIENDEKWEPTDLHSETTRHAFPNLDPSSPEFKKKRKLGKRANFLKVYQGGVQALQESLEIDRETAEALDGAFYKAFPRIRDYQDWVTKTLSEYGYVENLYGRRYYMNDSKWFYKGCNYLIQGKIAHLPLSI